MRQVGAVLKGWLALGIVGAACRIHGVRAIVGRLVPAFEPGVYTISYIPCRNRSDREQVVGRH